MLTLLWMAGCWKRVPSTFEGCEAEWKVSSLERRMGIGSNKSYLWSVLLGTWKNASRTNERTPDTQQIVNNRCLSRGSLGGLRGIFGVCPTFYCLCGGIGQWSDFSYVWFQGLFYLNFFPFSLLLLNKTNCLWRVRSYFQKLNLWISFSNKWSLFLSAFPLKYGICNWQIVLVIDLWCLLSY